MLTNATQWVMIKFVMMTNVSICQNRDGQSFHRRISFYQWGFPANQSTRAKVLLETMIFVPTNYVVVVVGYPRRRRCARRTAAALQRGGSPFSLLTNSFDRSSSMVQPTAVVCRDIAIGRCESHEDFIVEFEIGFFQTWPRSGFPISSSLYYI